MTLVNKSATSIAVNWTSSDVADGYVVYVNDSAELILTGGDNTTTTVNGLMPLTTYSITVRAYQDLLGPSSVPLNVTTEDLFSPMPASTEQGKDSAI